MRDGKLEIDADVASSLNDQLRDAAQRGVAALLHRRHHHHAFALVVVRYHRWPIPSMTWRIVYNALTRQWRAGVGELNLPVSSLDEAMDMVRHIRGWAVAGRRRAFDGVYAMTGRLRLRLDTSMLARPFQVNALNSSSWSRGRNSPWAMKTSTFASSPIALGEGRQGAHETAPAHRPGRGRAGGRCCCWACWPGPPAMPRASRATTMPCCC